jgi:hypothetical protein
MKWCRWIGIYVTRILIGPAAADQATDRGRANRGAALRAGDRAPAILGGLTSGAPLAGVYQADAKDAVVRSRRYLMNGRRSRLPRQLDAGPLEPLISCQGRSFAARRDAAIIGVFTRPAIGGSALPS